MGSSALVLGPVTGRGGKMSLGYRYIYRWVGFFLLLSDFNLALNSDRESLSMQPNFSIKRGCNLTSLLHRVFKKVVSSVAIRHQLSCFRCWLLSSVTKHGFLRC